MFHTITARLLLLLVCLVVVAPGAAFADPESCAQMRKSILDMEAKSVRPVGWVALDAYLRSLYARSCVLKPTRKAGTEYWYRQNGTPLGLQAGYTPPGWDPRKPYQPEEGAYTTTPAIAAACAATTNPSMCAMMKEVEQDCLNPVDTETRAQCDGILNGRVPDLPRPGEPLPPITALLAPAPPGVAPVDGKAVAADPGFQRMCSEARTSFNACAVRRQNMMSMGSGSLGGTGQAGAFWECQKLYAGVLNMCTAIKVQKLPPVAVAAPSNPVPPGAGQKPGDSSGRSAPPSHSTCPPGTTLNKDGYCLRADQRYCGNGQMCSDGKVCTSGGRCFYANGCFPGDIRTATGDCISAGSVDCGNGRYCNPGTYCLPGGGCGGGPPATGPSCSPGFRAPAGNLCTPTGGTYDPREAKLCGTKVCDIRAECGQDKCLSPIHQTAASRPGGGH